MLWSYGEFLLSDIGRRCFTGNAIDQSGVDVEEVDPNFMTATLILFLETQRAVGDGEGSMHTDLPSFSDPGGLKNPHTSDHSPGIPPGSHNGGARWQW